MAGSKISVVDSDTEVIPRYTDAFEIFRRTCRPGRQLPESEIGAGADRRIVWDSLAITEFVAGQFPAGEISANG